MRRQTQALRGLQMAGCAQRVLQQLSRTGTHAQADSSAKRRADGWMCSKDTAADESLAAVRDRNAGRDVQQEGQAALGVRRGGVQATPAALNPAEIGLVLRWSARACRACLSRV